MSHSKEILQLVYLLIMREPTMTNAPPVAQDVDAGEKYRDECKFRCDSVFPPSAYQCKTSVGAGIETEHVPLMLALSMNAVTGLVPINVPICTD
jgi:hypothetical protein